MTGSEFISAYSKRGPAAWESAVVALANAGALLIPPLVRVPLSAPGLSGTALVTSDYVMMGVPGDALRIPLTPGAAQAVANAYGSLLPTKNLVDAIWQTASRKMEPNPLVPNKGANMEQYASHSATIDNQLHQAGAEFGELVAGIKKDVVISNAMTPGKVVIYGWHKPNGQPIQPLSNVHGDFYVDYSHGIRLVAPTMQIDGRGEVPTEQVYKDPVLSQLVANSPIKQVRYPAPGATPAPAQNLTSFTSLLVRGLQVLVHLSQASQRRPV